MGALGPPATVTPMRRLLPLLLLVACGDSNASGGDAPGTSSGMPGSSTGGPGTTTGSAETTAEPSTSAPGTETGAASSSTGGETPAVYEDVGPYGVGLRTETLDVGERTLHVTLWYPTDTGGGSTPLVDLVPQARRAALTEVMDAAPDSCTRKTAEGTVDAAVADGTFPVVMVSHCYACLGLSSSFIAERLASHGTIVIAMTHTGGSLFESLEGNPGPLDGDFLQVRAADVIGTFDAMSSTGPLAASMDTSRVGMFGHSYGATTTGLVLQDDDRFSAGVAIAAPIENPLLPGVATADVAEPMLYLLMEEDNSIQEIGNNLLRNNAMAMPGGSWLVELGDAGHWSPSDLCAAVDDFMPCCGDDDRQTDGTPFTYLDADTGRSISAAYVTAFFALHLQGDAAAEAYLDAPTPEDVVTVTRYP